MRAGDDPSALEALRELALRPDGQVLCRPSLQDGAAHAGLSTPAGGPCYDLVVVGGGPAGLGAALYGASRGLRTLAPGVDDLAGRGVYYGAAAHEAVNWKDQDVYVVGAAKSAIQAALYFARYARRVVVLARSGDLRRSMSNYLVSRIDDDPALEVPTCGELTHVPTPAGATFRVRLPLRRAG